MRSDDDIERPQLTWLLADQFAAFGDERPLVASAAVRGQMLEFSFLWPLLPADEVVIDAGRKSNVVQFRLAVLEEAAVPMAELVELDLRRKVIRSLPDLGPDVRRARIVFHLGDRHLPDLESIEGLRNWAAQVRRRTRARRAELRRQREELARRTRRDDSR